MFPFILLALGSLIPSSECSNENRILTLIQKMESAFNTMEDYTCEVEQIFFQKGVEDQRYRFKYYFKKNKKIRVDFSSPYPSLTIFYRGGEKEATVLPFRFMPALKFRMSIDNPTIKTLAGQRIDQTDMGYFIDFLLKNIKKVEQGEDELQEDGEKVTFFFWALDYIEEKTPEKYLISVSKKILLPLHIERYNLQGDLLEVTHIKNYTINGHLEDRLFQS